MYVRGQWQSYLKDPVPFALVQWLMDVDQMVVRVREYRENWERAQTQQEKDCWVNDFWTTEGELRELWKKYPK